MRKNEDLHIKLQILIHDLKADITRINKVTLYDLHKRGRKVKVYRLVAEAFLANPNAYLSIKHKDEDKANNNINNLEWCTVLYNNTYGTARQRAA